jgi:hypothetical protein
MPVKSKAQNAWAHTPEGIKALGGKKKLKEWEVSGTAFDALPEHVSDKPKKRLRYVTRPRPS